MEYTVHLEDKIMNIHQNILIQIPVIKNIINNTDQTNNKLNLEKFDYLSFYNIVQVIRFSHNNSENETLKYLTNIIQEMNVENLINFIYTTYNLELQSYCQEASNYFLFVFKNNNVEYIKKNLNCSSVNKNLNCSSTHTEIDDNKIFNIIHK